MNIKRLTNCPMVSVIVPVYNVGRYLEACVDSVLCQTYRDFELLLVDDGSTDGSERICEEYARKDSRVRVFHKENGGLSSARNRGIEEARGKWIVFLDSDDVWGNPEGLDRIYQYAIHRNLDLLRFEYVSVREDLSPCEMPISKGKHSLAGRVLSNGELVRDAVHGEWFSVLFLQKSSLLRSLRFNEVVSFQEDIDFYCRLFALAEYRCGYIDEPMYLYRKRNGSISVVPRPFNLRDSFRLCDVFWQQSLHISDKRLRQYYVHYSVMMYYWTLQTLASEVYYDSRDAIMNRLGLPALHQRIKSRMRQAAINMIYWPFVIPKPSIGVRLLHLKDVVRTALK